MRQIEERFSLRDLGHQNTYFTCIQYFRQRVDNRFSYLLSTSEIINLSDSKDCIAFFDPDEH